MSDEDFRAYLGTQGYLRVRKLPTGDWLGIIPRLFHFDLCVGLDDTGFRDWYTYQDLADVVQASAEWDGKGRPPGNWNRGIFGPWGSKTEIRRPEMMPPPSNVDGFNGE